MKDNSWTIKIEKDEFSKDFYIILPEELLEKMEWTVGDKLKMEIVKFGIGKHLKIEKKQNKGESKNG